MSNETIIKGADGMPKSAEINKGVVLEKTTKRITNLSKNEKIYAQGDGLMKIAPFDNYYLFTIYSELNVEDVPVDIHNMGSFFLTFKDKDSEVRIENFKNTKSVDPTNGQILFRISQEDAEKILSLNTNIFYVTSMLYDDKSKSDETVLYSGRFAEYNDANVSYLTDEIETLKAELERVNKEKTKNEEKLQKQITDLSDALVKLRTEYSSLEETLNSYKDAYTEATKNNQDTSTKVEEKIDEESMKKVDEVIEQNNIIQEAEKEPENKQKTNSAINVLRQNIIGIKTITPVFNQEKNKAKQEDTMYEAKMALANTIVKKGVIDIYAFFYTKYSELKTAAQQKWYTSLDTIYKNIQTLIKGNSAYTNTDYDIIYAEKDYGKLMEKYNINTNCILVVKDGKVLGKVNTTNTSNHVLVLYNIKKIIDENNK
jgi:hypothetical protein